MRESADGELLRGDLKGWGTLAKGRPRTYTSNAEDEQPGQLRGEGGGGGGQWGGDLAILTSFSLGWVRQAADGPGLEDEAES